MSIGKNNCLLVVADNTKDLMALRNMFQLDYILYTAKDGREAVTKAEKYMPDLILTEMILPDTDAYALIAELRELDKTREIPVILIADNTAQIDGGLKAADYIIKPFNPSVAELKVRHHIENINQRQDLARAEKEKKQKEEEIKREYMPYGKVLLVDDMAINLEIDKMIIELYGIKVDTANNGFDAIELIKKGNIYDVVFMDYMMPVMDGIETVKIIRGLGYGEPIIALSANVIKAQVAVFLSSGFDSFIGRPMDLYILDDLLNRLIRGKQTPETLEAAKKSEIKKTDA